MKIQYPTINQYFQSHSSWKLLRADHSPLIITFLYNAFIDENVRTLSQSHLVSSLDDTLYHLRKIYGDDIFPKSSHSYLDDWAHEDKGWLRKFYPVDSDEPHFDLTPATEKVMNWVESLTTQTFVGTESRLLSLFDLLKQMITGSQTDTETRIHELEQQKKLIDQEIEDLKNGKIEIMNETALVERFMLFKKTARELLSDFRQVEYNFRLLDREVREKIATWSGSKGDLLEDIFGNRDAITDSDQGRSFHAFWDFLMSSKSQEEFTVFLEQLFKIPAIEIFSNEKRLKRIHFDWLEAGEYTQRTVASLSQQLRKYLDNQAYLENKRIMDIIQNIKEKAIHIRDNSPKGVFMHMDSLSPDIHLPMERKLFSPPLNVELDSMISLADETETDASKLFDQVFIDKTKLIQNIQNELYKHNQITLKELVDTHPLSRGLAELISYISIVLSSFETVIDDDHNDSIAWTDENGHRREATFHRMIITRK